METFATKALCYIIMMSLSKKYNMMILDGIWAFLPFKHSVDKISRKNKLQTPS
jgi:hypothetical protein